MALLHRANNISSFLTWPRMKAAFGLLSSDVRRTWVQTIDTPHLSRAPLDKIYPWFSFQSIDYLAQISSPGMRVLEFGCGYSTVWWAQRVSQVTSIERSRSWIAEVQHALAKHAMTNVDLVHFSGFAETTEEEIRAASNPIRLTPVIQEYVAAGHGQSELYDIVVVDDIFRNETSEAAIARLKPGGILVLDDSERSRYAATFDLFNRMGWSFASFYGVTPYHFHEKQTTIWHKPVHV